MKLIIAGSRTIDRMSAVEEAFRLSEFVPFLVTKVVSGHCPDGVDALGERWAEERGILVKRFPADWKKFGRMAGPLRNQQMVDFADGLLAVWDGKSRGTNDVIRRAEERRLPTFIYWP